MAGLRGIAWLALVVLIAFIAMVAAEVWIPLVLAGLLATLLRPFVGALEAIRIPTFVGAFLVVGGASLLLAGVVQLAQAPAARAIEDLPRAANRVADEVRDFKRVWSDRTSLSQTFDVIEDLQAEGTNAVPRVVIDAPGLEERLMAIGMNITIGALVVVLLSYFFLVHGDTLFRRLIEVTPTLRDKKRVVEIVRAVQADSSRYLLVITAINAGLACVVALVLLALDVPNALFWGLVAGVANYVPYLGPVVLACALLLVGFGNPANEDWVDALIPAAAYVAVNGIEANFVTPTLLGRHFAINPLVILVWLMLWGWLWGVPGLLLGVPLLVCTKVIFLRVDRLQPWAVLMGARKADELPNDRS